MNKILKFFIIALVVIPMMMAGFTSCKKSPSDSPQLSSPNDSIPVPDGWKLVWNDEFNGRNIDTEKWEHEVNGWDGGNNELQYYTDRVENSYISDGCLVIKALKETYTGSDGTRDYTSARLRTANKGDWLYGRFEIRAKLPIGKGLWPAIWMLPTDWVYGGWPTSGEIDIMELVGHEPWHVFGTIHFGGSGNHLQSGTDYSLSSGLFSDDFHVFTVEWERTEMRWYVDGNLYQTINSWSTTAAQYPAPFDQRFHLLLNVAVGGDWPGEPDATTVFPQTMKVDYVRVFQRDITK